MLYQIKQLSATLNCRKIHIKIMQNTLPSVIIHVALPKKLDLTSKKQNKLTKHEKNNSRHYGRPRLIMVLDP